MSKEFPSSILLYLNTSTAPSVSLSPLKSLLAILVAAKSPLFIVLHPHVPRLDKDFYLLLALVYICPSEVLVRLEYFPTVFVPIPFVISLGAPMFKESGFLPGCLELLFRQHLETFDVSCYGVPCCHPSGTIDFLNIRIPGHQTNLYASLIRQISCCCRDWHFRS